MLDGVSKARLRTLYISSFIASNGKMKKVRVKVKDSGIHKFQHPCFILRTDCLIKHATEREIEGRIEVTGKTRKKTLALTG